MESTFHNQETVVVNIIVLGRIVFGLSSLSTVPCEENKFILYWVKSSLVMQTSMCLLMIDGCLVVL